MSVMQEISSATMIGNTEKVLSGIEQALSEGQTPEEIIEVGLIDAMSIIGQRFKDQEIFVPEMLIAARAMKAGLEKLKPLIVGRQMNSLATVVLGTVKGDLHDIGKNIVRIMMESNGCQVYDIGVDVSPQRFVDALKQYRPQVLGLSALLTTTLPAMKETIQIVEFAGIRNQVKIIVGGAPVTRKFAEEIGADGYTNNAGEVGDLIRSLL